MASINIDLNFFEHPKTMKLCGILGQSASTTIIKLWVYAAKFHSFNAQLDGYTTSMIEQIIQWTGEPGKAVEALIVSGFLETTEKGYKLHDWREYQGHIHAIKVRNRKVAENRWKKIKKAQLPSIPVVYQKDTISMPYLSVLSKEDKNNRTPEKFIKPTQEEITAYAKSIGFELNGQVFYDFYESKGWKIGKNSMKNWQAAVRTWKNSDRRENKKPFENIGVTDDGFPDYK